MAFDVDAALAAYARVKADLCRTHGGPTPAMPMLHIEFRSGDGAMAIIEGPLEQILPISFEQARMAGEPVAAITLHDAVTREASADRVDDDYQPGDLIKAVAAGQFADLHDALVLSHVTITGESQSIGVEYRYDDHGQPVFGRRAVFAETPVAEATMRHLFGLAPVSP